MNLKLSVFSELIQSCTFPCEVWFAGFLVVFVIDVPARFNSADVTVGLLLLGGELLFCRKRKFNFFVINN